MVLPLIAAGIGIVATIASLKAQSDATAAQNKSIAGQIYAEQKSEVIRKSTAAFQAKQVVQQAQLETAQRRAAFREQDNALKLSALQVQTEQRIAAVKANAQSEVNRRQLRDLSANLETQKVNNKVNSTKQRADLAAQLSSKSTLNAPADVVNRRSNTDAGLAAQRLTGGTTSQAIRADATGEAEVNAAIAESLRTESLKQRELDSFDKYNTYSEFNQALQSGLSLGNAAYAVDDADKRIKEALSINAQLTDVNLASVANQRAQLRTSRNITNTNAKNDVRLRKAELLANSNLSAAKSALSQSQMYSQRSPGVNLGSALGSVAQQALPLVGSLVKTAQVRTPSVPEYGTSTDIGYELSAPVLNGNYDYSGTSGFSSGTLGTYKR
jgi:hypothetical protein